MFPAKFNHHGLNQKRIHLLHVTVKTHFLEQVNLEEKDVSSYICYYEIEHVELRKTKEQSKPFLSEGKQTNLLLMFCFKQPKK